MNGLLAASKLKDLHPTLYKTYLLFAVLSIALGLNFYYLTPPFMPLSVPKEPVSLVFLGCGVIKLMLLLIKSKHSWLRLSMATSVAIYTFWAIALTADFFLRSQTSLQLPIFVMGLAALGGLLLLEPFINPVTATATIAVAVSEQ